LSEDRAPYLYILCGLPFSGKSTLAHALSRSLNLQVVAMDRVNDERGLGHNGQRITAQQWFETYAACYRRLTEALEARRSVIFDAPSFTRGQRDELRALADECGASVRVVYVQVPNEVARLRWQANRANARRHDVRDDDFSLVEINFEAPTPDEEPLIYDGESEPSEWAESMHVKPGG